jgi:hypothetical protein
MVIYGIQRHISDKGIVFVSCPKCDYIIDGQVCLVRSNRQTTNFYFNDQQTVNGLRKIARASDFHFKGQRI